MDAAKTGLRHSVNQDLQPWGAQQSQMLDLLKSEESKVINQFSKEAVKRTHNKIQAIQAERSKQQSFQSQLRKYQKIKAAQLSARRQSINFIQKNKQDLRNNLAAMEYFQHSNPSNPLTTLQFQENKSLCPNHEKPVQANPVNYSVFLLSQPENKKVKSMYRHMLNFVRCQSNRLENNKNSSRVNRGSTQIFRKDEDSLERTLKRKQVIRQRNLRSAQKVRKASEVSHCSEQNIRLAQTITYQTPKKYTFNHRKLNKRVSTFDDNRDFKDCLNVRTVGSFDPSKQKTHKKRAVYTSRSLNRKANSLNFEGRCTYF